MNCRICNEPIIDCGFNLAREKIADILKELHGIEAHASCALDLFYKARVTCPRGEIDRRASFTSVNQFIRVEFWNLHSVLNLFDGRK